VRTTHPPTHITPRQLEVLKSLWQMEARQCYSPTIGELAEKLAVSRTTAFEHIAALREKGLVSKSKGKARSLKLTAQASLLLEAPPQNKPTGDLKQPGLAMFGRVAAGAPIEAIANIEMITLKDMFGTGDDVFLLEVAGDSMIDDGIEDGNYLVCKKTSTAVNGQIVVAIVDNEDATVKRFYSEQGRIRLQPANQAYEPIYSDNCRIEAVVIGLLKHL
jgi:repressor LexA